MSASTSTHSMSGATRLSTRSLARSMFVYFVLLVFSSARVGGRALDLTTGSATKQVNLCGAILNYTYVDASTSVRRWDGGEWGRFGLTSRLESERGRLVHVHTADGARHGCTAAVNAPTDGRPWIALVERGQCKFQQKIHAATIVGNASAVIIYNHVHEGDLILMTMGMQVNSSVSIFVHRAVGERLAALVDSGIVVTMGVSVGQIKMYDYRVKSVVAGGPRFTPLLAISLTMIAFLMCGLAGLLAYAIRRAKYLQKKAHARTVFTLQHRSQQTVQESLLASETFSHESTDSAIYCR